MSPGQIFSIANAIALASWILLAALPGRPWVTRVVARKRGIPHLIGLPCLLLTFLFGPAGWLLYRSVRLFRAIPDEIRKPAASTATD